MARVEDVKAYDGPGEQASPQGTVTDEGDPKFLACVNYSNALDIEREGRVFELHSRNRVYCMCTPEGVHRAAGEAKVLHFSGSRWRNVRLRRMSGAGRSYLTCSAIAPTVSCNIH